MIGCSLKKVTDQPIHKQFSKIKKGDNIVYYATGDKVLLGIFRVTSEMEILNDDPEWGDIAIFRVNHDPKGRDFIVCWVDDVEGDEKLKKRLPEIIDLKKELSNFIYSKQPRY